MVVLFLPLLESCLISRGACVISIILLVYHCLLFFRRFHVLTSFVDQQFQSRQYNNSTRFIYDASTLSWRVKNGNNLVILQFRVTKTWESTETKKNAVHFELHTFCIFHFLVCPATFVSAWLNMEIHVTPCFWRHAGKTFHTLHTANLTLEVIMNCQFNVDALYCSSSSFYVCAFPFNNVVKRLLWRVLVDVFVAVLFPDCLQQWQAHSSFP